MLIKLTDWKDSLIEFWLLSEDIHAMIRVPQKRSELIINPKEEQEVEHTTLITPHGRYSVRETPTQINALIAEKAKD